MSAVLLKAGEKPGDNIKKRIKSTKASREEKTTRSYNAEKINYKPHEGASI